VVVPYLSQHRQQGRRLAQSSYVHVHLAGSIIEGEVAVAKERRTLQEIYRGIRKPMAPPAKVEKDRRGRMREREDRKEMDEHRGKVRPGGED
jgi:hypothetical protein